MIEQLKGIHETVSYKTNTHLRLYYNSENEHYPMHWHTELEILCPIQEDYVAICNNVRYTLNETDMLFIFPGVVHELPATPVGKRIIFQVDGNFLNTIHDVKTIFSLMAPAVHVSAKATPELHKKIFPMMQEIQKLYTEGPLLYEASIMSRTLEMVAILGREYESHPMTLHMAEGVSQSNSKYNETMTNVCNYISIHCSENLTLDQMAEYAGFSKFHFERLFKQSTGLTFYQYLTQKRISYAEFLLTNPSLSITEIAYRSGFSSGSTFARTFRQLKDYSPSDFRSMRKK
jgi:AraC-like DNA-binding protein